MKTTTVNFSDLAEYNRMDAGFFITLSEVKEVVEKIKQNYTKTQVLDILKSIDKKDKESVLALSWGNEKKDADIICSQYPYISLALLKNDLNHTINKVQQEINDKTIYLQKIQEIEADVKQNLEPSDDFAP